MDRILILGASGMLGHSLFKYLNQNGEFDILPQVKNNNLYNKASLVTDIKDIANEDVLNIILKFNPTFIINCIANVNLESCELDPKNAFFINSDFINFIGDKLNNSHFIQISTDSVFDGEKGNYDENDIPGPLNIYAKSKLKAETIVSNKFINYTILRTNIFGKHFYDCNNSLAEWAINQLKLKQNIKGFNDVFFNPVHTIQLSELIYKIIRNPYTGILNVGTNRSISKFHFLNLIAKRFSFPQELIETSSVMDFQSKIQRPLNTTLNVNFLKQMFELEFTIEQGIKHLT
jgi:dTDP-4-dehydrorhamnose reductase